MKKYAHLFFDLDHTLWDFETNSRATLTELYEAERLVDLGIPSAAKYIVAYEEINAGLWTRYENGTLDKAVLRVLRFRNSLLHFGVRDRGLSERMGRDYIELCPRKPALMDGALELLNDLHSTYRLHIITNGFDEVQRVKLECSAIGDYFDVVLTSEMAAARKPHPKIFAMALKHAKAQATNSLMIGDNLHADVKGARDAGWDQAYFSPTGNVDTMATYSVRNLGELRPILL